MSGQQFGGSWASANSLVFTDLMKHAAGWSGGSRWNGSALSGWGYLDLKQVPMRSDGYPAGISPTPGMLWSVVATIGQGRAHYKAGRYVVLYDGSGTVELEGDAASPPVSSALGRVVVDVTPNNSTLGLRVRITSSSPDNPVVNIRVVPQAYEATYNTTQVFHPDFLELLQGIPLLHFGGWMRVNGDANNGMQAPRDWATRTTTRHWSQARDSDGVAVEYLVMLANKVNASMWINLPRAANDSDSYTYNMVSYIASNLASSLTLTVEYGREGPGWLSTHLPTNTRLISAIARRAWAAAGRPVKQLRVVMASPGATLLANVFGNTGTNFSFIDAIALPASFGGMEYFTWPTRPNPTAWGDPNYFRVGRPEYSVEQMLKLLRSSVIAADAAWNKNFQLLKSMGIEVVGYGAGPQLVGPRYGARANYDRAYGTCGRSSATFPCNMTIIYPPWSDYSNPPWAAWDNATDFNATFNGILAVNASREARLEANLRTARLHDKMYDMMLDSLWRWHAQMGGSDLVVDLTRWALPCNLAPGASTATYNPEECRTNVTGIEPVAKPSSTPAYRALREWLAAAANGSAASFGTLPQSSATAPPPVASPPACSPACVYGSCVNGSCVCWAGVTGATCNTLPAPGSGGTPSACSQRVGMNLAGIADWSRSWDFVDVFKTSRAWISQSFVFSSPWSDGAAINLINATNGPGGPYAVGYPAKLGPAQRLSTLVMRDLATHIPGGIYTVLYDGKGVIDFSMYDVVDVEYVEAGHSRVTFKPSTNMNNGILVTIERTDPSDPIRNIRVIMPGYEVAALYGDQPFHPALLDYLRPFGLLRFMDWMHTNVEELPKEWAERPTTYSRSYATSPGGVPVEVMVKLSNMLGADPWFNLPHVASDDYIAQFATAVRDSLRPDLRVYVEYSNEVWHTGFPGGQYAQSMGLSMNLTEEGARWYGGAINEARLCFAGQKTANISKIWKAAWGNRSSQVVVVVSGQGVWPITSAKLLSCGNAGAHIDALAIAPYFGDYNKNRDTDLELFVNTTIPAQINDTLVNYVAQHAAIARNFSKPLLCYEAGQGMAGDGSETDLAIQANRHPAMTGLYRQYLAGLEQLNVSRIAHFSSVGAYTKYGSWGLMEAMDWDRNEAPKYKGLMAYLNGTLICPLPAAPAPASCPGTGCSGNGVCLANGRCMCYSGYSGDDCSNVTYVEVYNCGYYCTFGQGECNVSTVHKNIRTWSCSCKPGITGLTCSINRCPNDCSWNGDCLDQGVCACYPGYTGADCSTDCGCGGHGRCDGNGGCICDVGWRLGSSGKCEWDCRGCANGTSCIGPGECSCAEKCVYGTCFHGSCRCWAGYGGPACNVSEADVAAGSAAAGNVSFVPRLNRGSLAGVNLGGLAYWSTDWVWIDLMKSSSAWFTSYVPDTVLVNAWDAGIPLDLRPDGYPARLPPNVTAHKLLQRNVLLHTWPGRYVVLYDGDGRLDFNFDAHVAARAKGRMEIVFTPTADLACAATGAAYCGDNGIHLVITTTNPANPIRNIRILPAGDGGAGSAGGAGAGGAWEGRADRVVFHPWFLKSIARFRTIRFMTWLETNNNGSWTDPKTAWKTRTTPAHDTQAGPGGAALEHMIQLCNLVGADPWVNVHHLADDEYVAAMAAMVRDSLRPDVKVYVEHSNEVWNPLFSQHDFAVSRGLALNLSSDKSFASYRYHTLRTLQIAQIFKAAFASAPGGGAARIKVVLGSWGFLCNNGQGCGTEVLRQSLGWNNSASKVDYVGFTGYWGCGLGGSGPTDVLLTVDQMVSRCYSAINQTEADAKALAAAAASYGVPIITYEAGPSIVEAAAIERGSFTAGLAEKFIALNRHQAMYDLYVKYLEVFRRAGFVGEGRPWMQFVSTAMAGKYGSWGIKEYTGQPLADAPKYRGLMEWLDNQANYTATNSSNTGGNTGGDGSSDSTTGIRAAPPRRPLCLSLRGSGGASGGVSGAFGGGGVGLGEGVLAGAPAVLLPAAGQVWVPGLTVAIRWSTVGWASGSSPPLEITLWMDTDCATEPPSGATPDAQQRPAAQALAILAAEDIFNPAGQLDWRVPLPADSPALAAALATATAVPPTTAAAAGAGRPAARFFIRIRDGVSTNYSEPFDIVPRIVYAPSPWASCDCGASPPVQRRTLSCVANPAAAALTAAANLTSLPVGLAPTPTPACANFTGWNTTLPNIPGDPNCIIETYGCRTYRTGRGTWYWSSFKPVTDCVAQWSPWQLTSAAAAALAAAGNLTVAPPAVDASLCTAASPAGTAPATTQACPVGSCTSPSVLLSPPPPPPSSSSPSPSPSASPLPSPSPSPSPSSSPSSSPPPSQSPSPSTSASPSPSPSPSPSVSPSPSPSPSPSASPVETPYCQRDSTAASLVRLNAGATTCDLGAEDSCDDSDVCTAVPNCKRWACDAATQALVQISCSALCQPRALTFTAARISDDGRIVAVALSGRAASLVAVSCASVFDVVSAALLGSAASALCSTAGDDSVLVAKLAADATLVAGQMLTLRSSGSALVSTLNRSRAFTGSVTVSTCSSCASPIATLSGPTTVSRSSCESAAGSLLASVTAAASPAFDASQSSDPSGRSRWAAVRWSLPDTEDESESTPSAAEAAALAALRGAINRANGRADMSDRLRLDLNSTEVAALQDNTAYTVKVTVTSWLGTSDSDTATFTLVASSPAPSVSIDGAAVQSFRLATGLRLAASVAGGGCKGRTLSWNWTSPSGWSGLPASGLAGQSLVVKGPVTSAVHGQTITVRVTASYDNGGASASADVVVRAEGSPPLAALTGPAGDIPDNVTLVLNATASSDPDRSASSGSSSGLSYVWDCRRDDYPTPCFSSAQQGDQTSTPGLWTVPAGLLENGRLYTITVTLVKAVASGASPLNASASLSFRPRSAAAVFPRGNLTRQCAASPCAAPHSTERSLTVLLQLVSPYNTTATAAAVTVAWSSAETPGVANLTAITAATSNTTSTLPPGAFLLTIPAALLPASRSSITITATMTAAAIAGVADAASGSATLTVPLNGAPYCSLNASYAAACVAVTVLNSTFGSASVALRARGWADGTADASGGTDGSGSGAELVYEFGLRQYGMDLMQQRGAATSATVVGLPQGVVQLYGCAIDAYGSRSCGRTNVTVDPPGSGFNALAAMAAVNVSELAKAGDQRLLLQAAYQLAQLALAFNATGNSTAGTNSSAADANSTAAVARLLSDMSVTLVGSLLTGGALADPEQAPQAIAAIASLATSAAQLSDAAKDAYLSAVKSALQTLPGATSDTNSTSSSSSATTGSSLYNFITQLCRLLGASLPSASTSSNTTTAGHRRRTLLADSGAEAARARLAELLAASDRLGNALGLQAVPLAPYIATGGDGVFVSAGALPDATLTGSGTASTSTSVQVRAGPDAVATTTTSSSGAASRRLRLLAATSTLSAASADGNADAQVVLTGTAAVAASGYGIDLQYAPSAAAGLQTALATTLPSGLTLLGSGLATVTWNAPSGSSAATVTPPLDGSSSYLVLTVPAPGYDATRPVACLSYNVTSNAVSGNLTGLPAGVSYTGVTVAPSYDSSTGRVTCRLSAMGSYVVAQAPPATAQTNSGDDDDDDKKRNLGLILGLVLGLVLGLTLIVLVLVVVFTKRAKSRAKVQPANDDA